MINACVPVPVLMSSPSVSVLSLLCQVEMLCFIFGGDLSLASRAAL